MRQDTVIIMHEVRRELGEITKDQTVEITREQYENIVSTDTLKFFRRLGGSERASRSYTSQGYIVTKLNSKSPCGTMRTVREFQIKGDK